MCLSESMINLLISDHYHNYPHQNRLFGGYTSFSDPPRWIEIGTSPTRRIL